MSDRLDREPATEQRNLLRAGQATVDLVAGELRYLRIGTTEVVRRIYATVRDADWNTVSAAIHNLRIEDRSGSFIAEFDAIHGGAEPIFRWHGKINGERDGTIRFSMNGVAMRDFRYCRVGFCLLLSSAGYAGCEYVARTTSGPIRGRLPSLVGPQPYVDGVYWPLFPSFSGLAVTQPNGGTIDATFEGDLFELEDQRNWGDGSFKAYCTPAVLGNPFQAREGQEFHQALSVALKAMKAPPRAPGPIRLELSESSWRLPQLGFTLADDEAGLSPREASLLRRLNPAHLRVDVWPRRSSWVDGLNQARHAAESLDAGLEVALFLTGDAEPELRKISEGIRDLRVVRFLVFDETTAATGTTTPQLLRIAREFLSAVAPTARFIAGTDGSFAELNRSRPVAAVADGISYPMNPQVHMADTDTLVESLDSVSAAVLTARDIIGDRPVHVSAITLKPPFRQGPPADLGLGDQLPPSVDVRQAERFVAGWTLAYIRRLCEGGAASATFYETTGWRGLIETQFESRARDGFPSTPGLIFPVYQVFADLAAWRSAAVLALHSSDPLRVDGLALRHGRKTHVLVANLTSEIQFVHLGDFASGEYTIARRLETSSYRRPRDRGPSQRTAIRDIGAQHRLEIQVEPYEVVRIDQTAGFRVGRESGLQIG